MEKLLKVLNLNIEEDWEAIAKCKSKRKMSTQDHSTQYMKFLEFQENHDIDENDGFRTIESLNRVQKLRLSKQKPIIQTAPVQIAQTQVVYNYPVHKTKASKIKKAMATKVQTKVKFANIGAVKSEWTEINEFNYSSVPKTKIEYVLTTLSEVKDLPYFNQALLQIKPKKPVLLKIKNENIFNPETLLKNQTLTKLFSEEVIPEGEFGLFMMEHTLVSLASILKREFPFNISIIKQNNKFAFISDFNNNNFFSVVKSYNENSQKPVSEKEDEIANLSIENSLIEENLFLNSARDPASASLSQLKYFKLTLEDTLKDNSKVKFHIYSNVRIDCLNPKGDTMLVRSLFEDDKHWHNLENKMDEIVTNSLMNNGSRVFEWIFSAFLAGSQQLALGLVSRLRHSDVGQHVVNKVVCKGFNELSKLYNLNKNEFLALLCSIFRNVTQQITENGQFAMHKVAYKPNLKFFHTDK